LKITYMLLSTFSASLSNYILGYSEELFVRDDQKSTVASS